MEGHDQAKSQDAVHGQAAGNQQAKVGAEDGGCGSDHHQRPSEDNNGNDNDQGNLAMNMMLEDENTFSIDIQAPHPDAIQHALDMAHATQRSMTETATVGAFHVDGPGAGMGSRLADTTSMYDSNSNMNLPYANIDIIAEATLVTEDDDDNDQQDEEVQAMREGCARVQVQNVASTAITSAETPTSGHVVHAQRMDNNAVYIFGRYARLRLWHLILIAFLVAILTIVIVVPITHRKKPLKPIDTTTSDATATVASSSSTIWQQLGSNIYGDSANDRSGSSVDISNNGQILAVSAHLNDNNGGIDAGHVRVYIWNQTLGDWNQRGSDLNGEMVGDHFGWSISLSGDGDELVVGAPEHDVNDSGQVSVFKWDEELSDYVTWGTVHELTGSSGDFLGGSVDVSDDGKTIAVGAPAGEKRGHAQVYRWNDADGDWRMTGNPILADHDGDHTGEAVSLSADGEILAIGAPFYDGTNHDTNMSFDSGRVRVFALDADNKGALEWRLMGSPIDGKAQGDTSGFSVDLSDDGNILALGAPWSDGTAGDMSGRARVYAWNVTAMDWIQMGLDIDGEHEHDRFGLCVSLSSDGRTLAASSNLNEDNGFKAGHVRVFHWDEDSLDWMQVGHDLDGEEQHRTRAVALSADGLVVVVGAWGANGDDGGRYTGYTHIFQHHVGQ